MSITEFLTKVDKRYAWSLLGFLLAAILGMFTIYTEFLREERTSLRFEIVSDASVLDVREQLGDLEILYGGVDINKAQQSLRVVIVRIVNDGQQNILKGHYDEEAPLGFRITAGTIVRVETLNASSSYLRTTLEVQIENSMSALLAPVILEAGEWYSVKTLILHPEGDSPKLEPLGKVAGVQSVRVVDAAEAQDEPGFLLRAYSGGVLIQLARLIGYFISFIVVLAALIAPPAGVAAALSRRRRRRDVRDFRAYTDLELESKGKLVLERYIEGDFLLLRRLEHYIVKPDMLEKVFLAYMEDAAGDAELEGSLEEAELTERGVSPYPYLEERDFNVRTRYHMIRSGLIVRREGRLTVDPHVATILREFLRFLEVRGRLSHRLGDFLGAKGI